MRKKDVTTKFNRGISKKKKIEINKAEKKELKKVVSNAKSIAYETYKISWEQENERYFQARKNKGRKTMDF